MATQLGRDRRMTDNARAGSRLDRVRRDHGAFLHSMLLVWSLVQAVWGLVLIWIGLAVGVWYVTVLGVVSSVVGALIHREERHDQ